MTDFPFPDETTFHIAVAILLRKNLPLDVVWFHVPNGEERDIRVAKKLKEMGVRPGVADFLIFRANLNLALELKTPTGVLSKNQKGFRDRWVAQGRSYEIARNFDQAQSVLWKYGLL